MPEQPISIQGKLAIGCNVLAILVPAIFPKYSFGELRYFLPFLASPIFFLCIRWVLKSKASFTDDNEEHWEIDADEKPQLFWWVIWSSTVLGILLMLAIRSGAKL
jgi:hypothetical protein